MLAIGDIITLAVQGVGAAGLAGVGAILFGWYDRRRKSLVDDRVFESAEERQLRQDQAAFLAEIKLDREALRTRLKDCETEIEEVSNEKDRWHRAGIQMETWARDNLRIPASDAIMKLWSSMNVSQRRNFGDIPKLPEVPSLAMLAPPPSS